MASIALGACGQSGDRSEGRPTKAGAAGAPTAPATPAADGTSGTPGVAAAAGAPAQLTVTLPAARGADLKAGGVAILVASDGLAVRGQPPLLALSDGRLPAPPKGDDRTVVEPLLRALGSARGAVDLHVDRAVPYATLQRVAYTARRAGFTDVRLATREGAFQLAAPPSSPSGAGGPRQPLDLTLRWTDRGVMAQAVSRRRPTLFRDVVAVAGTCPTAPLRAGTLKADGLATVAAALCQVNGGGGLRITARATAQATVGALAEALGAATPAPPCRAEVVLGRGPAGGPADCRVAMLSKDLGAFHAAAESGRAIPPEARPAAPTPTEAAKAPALDRAKLPDPATLKIDLGAPRVGTGGPPARGVAKAVGATADALRTCYRRALALDPALTGIVTVSFTVDGQGAVKAPRVAATRRLQGGGLAACVQKVAADWTLPATGQAKAVPVDVPIQLSRTPPPE